MTGLQEATGAGTSGDDRHLEEELQRWIAASAITPEQAEAIRRIEGAGAHQEPPPSRIPLVAEALGFLGGALAVIAGIVATSRVWDEFSTGARLSLIGAVAAILVVAGRVVRREGEPALAHLGSFLWALATGTTAFWMALLALDVLDWEGADVVLVAGLATSLVAALLWAWRPAPLQHLVTLGAIGVALGGLAGQVEHVGGVFVGISLWALGAAWVILAWTGVVEPAPLGYAAGGLVAIVGGRVLGDETAAASILAILTALALLAASVPTRSMVLLWVGVVGVFVSVPSAVFAHFGDSLGAPVALFVVGMALIAVAVAASRLVREVRATPAEEPRFSRRTTAVALLGAVALVLGLTVGFTDIKKVPTFPSLRTTPDSSIEGTIAFVRRGPEKPCVYVIPASGVAQERRLLCATNIDGGAGALSWNAAEHIVVSEFTDQAPEAVEVDPADGRVLSRTRASFEGKGPMAALDRSPDGSTVEWTSSGTPRLIVHPPAGPARTVFVAAGPRDYRFDYAGWSPDGRYLVVMDSEARMLVIDVTSSSPVARVLTTGASSPAWTAAKAW